MGPSDLLAAPADTFEHLDWLVAEMDRQEQEEAEKAEREERRARMMARLKG